MNTGRPALLRQLRLAALALAGCVPLIAGSQTLSITATVLSKNKCTFNNTTATLNFGSLDPSATSPYTATADFVFRCIGSSPTATWSITSDDGLYETGVGSPRMRHGTNASQHIAYSLNVPASGTAPKNTDYTFTVTGTIAPAAFQNAVAGAYSDTVTINLNP